MFFEAISASLLVLIVVLSSIPPLPDVKLSQKEIGQMRDYALTYGAAVRQRTNRQETTMARHGTMPELIYQRQLEISADKVDVSTGIGRRSSMPSTDTETCTLGARDFSCAVSGFGQVLEKTSGTQGKKRAMMKLKT